MANATATAAPPQRKRTTMNLSVGAQRVLNRQRRITDAVYLAAGLTCFVLFHFAALFAAGVTLALLLIVFYDGFKIVSAAQFGVVMRLGGRLPGFLKERNFPYFVIPFVDRVEIYDYKVDSDTVDVEFFTRDRIEVKFKGSLQKRPSPYVPDDQGRVRFIEMNPETIRNGIIDAIKSVLGKIAGVELVDRFIRDRRALELLMNCEFRMERAPHRDRELFMPFIQGKRQQLTERITKLATSKEKDKEKIDEYEERIQLIDAILANPAADLAPELWIDFYTEHAKEIEKELVDSDDSSEIEERYGIEILAVLIADIDFTDETKKALERERQAEADLKGAQKLVEMRETLVQRAIAERTGVDPSELRQAVNSYLKLISPPKVVGLTGETNAVLERLGQGFLEFLRQGRKS